MWLRTRAPHSRCKNGESYTGTILKIIEKLVSFLMRARWWKPYPTKATLYYTSITKITWSRIAVRLMLIEGVSKVCSLRLIITILEGQFKLRLLSLFVMILPKKLIKRSFILWRRPQFMARLQKLIGSIIHHSLQTQKCVSLFLKF